MWQVEEYYTGVVHMLEVGDLRLKVYQWHHGDKRDWYGDASISHGQLLNRKYLGSGTALEAQEKLTSEVRQSLLRIVKFLSPKKDVAPNTCPACAYSVQKGETYCKECGYDFLVGGRVGRRMG